MDENPYSSPESTHNKEDNSLLGGVIMVFGAYVMPWFYCLVVMIPDYDPTLKSFFDEHGLSICICHMFFCMFVFLMGTFLVEN